MVIGTAQNMRFSIKNLFRVTFTEEILNGKPRISTFVINETTY